MVKVVVTGAGGFIGRALVPELAKNYRVAALVRKECDFGGGIEILKGDLTDFEFIRQATAGVAAIIHLGAATAGKEPSLILDSNVRGTYVLMEAAVQNKVPKVIFASSIAVYGCLTEESFIPAYLPVDENHPCLPRDVYGESKLLAEEILKFYTRKTGITTISLRLSAVVDTNIFPGDAHRHVLWSIIDVRDVVRVIELALESPIRGSEIFNVTADRICSSDNTPKLIKENYPGVRLIPDESYFQTNPRASILSNDKARRILGFNPRYKRNDE